MPKSLLESLSTAVLMAVCAFCTGRTQAAPLSADPQTETISALSSAQLVSEQSGGDYDRGYNRGDEDYGREYRRHRNRDYGYDHERRGRERGYDRDEDRDYDRGYRDRDSYDHERGDHTRGYDRDRRGDERGYDRGGNRDYRGGGDDDRGSDFDFDTEGYS